MFQRQTPTDRALGAALIIAPILLAASTVAYAAGGGFNDDQLGGSIQLYAMVLWFPAVLALTRLVATRFPSAAAVLTLAGAVAVAGGVGYALDSVYFAETGTTAEDFAAGPLVLQLPGAFFPATMLALGIAIAKAGPEHRRSGWLLAGAAVLFPASRVNGIEPLGLVADALFLLAMVPLGLRMLWGADAVTTGLTRAAARTSGSGAAS